MTRAHMCSIMRDFKMNRVKRGARMDDKFMFLAVKGNKPTKCSNKYIFFYFTAPTCFGLS
jgi:hypothetical protein